MSQRSAGHHLDLLFMGLAIETNIRPKIVNRFQSEVRMISRPAADLGPNLRLRNPILRPLSWVGFERSSLEIAGAKSITQPEKKCAQMENMAN